MDAKFQPSFIPKQPLASIPQSAISRISILYVIAVIVFIITGGLVAAELIAERVLNQDVASLNQQLIDAKSSFELATIEHLKFVSLETKTASTVLADHIALSKFLETLEQSTYTHIAFDSFSASVANPTDPLPVALAGTAASYNSLILQSEEFKALPFLQTPTFSDFVLNKDGSVSFKFSATIDPKLVNYQRYLIENQ